MGCRSLVQHARTIRHRARTAQNVWSPVYVDAMVLRDRDADLDDETGDFGQPGSGLEERLYVQTDANFNVTSLVDTAGDVVERFLYDPYGTFTVHDPNWTLDAGGSDFGWVHLHQGGRYDATTGLYHFRFRDYDPELGRWTRQDPAGYVDGGNLYEALLSSPVSWLDPSGRNSVPGYVGGAPPIEDDDIPTMRAATPRELRLAADPHYQQAMKRLSKFYENPNSVHPRQLMQIGWDLVNTGADPDLGYSILQSQATEGILAVLGGSKGAQYKGAKGHGHRPRPSLDSLAAAALAPSKNRLTRAGFEYQKHMNRNPQNRATPTILDRTARGYNYAGQHVVEDILTHPNSTVSTNRLGGWDYRLPSGVGVRFDSQGNFYCFID